MNPIDIAVLVILALFALAGLYRGFLTALFNLGAYLVAIIGSRSFSAPCVAAKSCNVRQKRVFRRFNQNF